MGIDRIDYSAWTNQQAIELAKQADKDGVNGLQGQEIFNFTKTAIDNNIGKAEIKKLFGLSASVKTRVENSTGANRTTNPDFDKAVNFYNENMDSSARYAVTRKSYDNLETRLYNMEKAIDEAYQTCEAYSDIIIIPRWHYRFYPRLNDQLINFDIDEIRARTTKDMQSLYELQDKANSIIEEANGETAHKEPEKINYDVDEIAKRHLGMSYEDFKKKYSKELDFCKTVSYADIKSMNAVQAEVYSKARAYAVEMVNTTITQAHTVNWDISGKRLDETLKASSNMMTISDFEYDGITDKGLGEIQSGIAFKAFEGALVDKYNELKPTGIVQTETEAKLKQPVKRLVNGAVLIFHPNGSIYDLNGNKIK